MPNNDYFQGNPVRLDTSRSRMRPKPPRWFGAWNVGVLVPIFACSTVMPGDTFKMSVSSVVRMLKPIFPVMDDMEITVEAFFVPHRLILSRKSMSPDVNDSNHSWDAFLGAQTSTLNMPVPGDVTLPKFHAGVSGPGSRLVGGLADCLGYPFSQSGDSSPYDVNCLKILAYYSIWNEYFREPNCQNPVTYTISSGYINPTGSDAGITASHGSYCHNYPLAPVSRYHGYFGSALPWPQRNTDEVKMPLGTWADVVTRSVEHTGMSDSIGASGLKFRDNQLGEGLGSNAYAGLFGNGGANPTELFASTNTGLAASSGSMVPTNLYADLSQATAATVNQFRLAVQTQRWYEALARCGNKYSDMIHGMFGVRGTSIPDRPEYLGGFTAPINMTQVAQTTGYSQTPGSNTLGNVGAYSVTNPGGFLFSKSFTDHGTIMVVACCRVNDSFCQGIDREDTKFDRFDYYWEQFANLGEQPIKKKELYVTGVASGDDMVFGYQEAWAEYRMFNDHVTGLMRPTVSGGLGFATYTTKFASQPSLKGFLDASNQANTVDQTLEVAHTTSGYQLYGSFAFQIEMTRPMPLYSIPGLVDHH